MTFGQTLKQILSVSGVRLAHLAGGLGYDSSYISRWINDIKKPSLKNNDDLFEKISRTVIGCSTESGLRQLRLQYCRSADDDLPEALSRALQDAYSDVPNSEPVAAYIERNATYFGEKKASFGFKNFADAFLDAARISGKDMVECICGTRLSVNGNINSGFFEAIMPGEGTKIQFRVMIHQLIDMRDFERNVDSCCAAICTFTRYKRGVLYTFYEYDGDAGDQPGVENYMLVEGSMLLLTFRNPLAKRIDTVLSFDRSILDSDFSFLKIELSFMPKVLKFMSREELRSNNQFLYDYIMDGNIRYFLDVMQPIFMSAQLFEKVAAAHGLNVDKGGFMAQYNNICAAPKEVILYRSALLNYIYNGEILVFGRLLTMDIDERIEHLEQLIGNIESGGCRLCILSDTNPLLNREDTKLSFFLSRKSGFMVAAGDAETPIIGFRSVRTIDHFNEFFSHMQNLDENYVTKGEQALDFIRRGIDISKSRR